MCFSDRHDFYIKLAQFSLSFIYVFFVHTGLRCSRVFPSEQAEGRFQLAAQFLAYVLHLLGAMASDNELSSCSSKASGL